MKNMQNQGLKIVVAFATSCILFISPASAQVSDFRLKTADSLFAIKQYTQSIEHYREILAKKEYTPAMLLKMAFIEEGLNHTGQALYYLNLYHLATQDRATLQKIDELATKFNLEGYAVTDTDRMLSFYHDNYASISLATTALAVLLLSLIFYTRQRLRQRPVVLTILLVLVLAGFLIHLNFGNRISTGIIATNATYVMDGPSAGASVVEIIRDGHRVEVIGKKDVWLRIRWDGEVAYIREHALQPLEL